MTENNNLLSSQLCESPGLTWDSLPQISMWLHPWSLGSGVTWGLILTSPSLPYSTPLQPLALVLQSRFSSPVFSCFTALHYCLTFNIIYLQGNCYFLRSLHSQDTSSLRTGIFVQFIHRYFPMPGTWAVPKTHPWNE